MKPLNSWAHRWKLAPQVLYLWIASVLAHIAVAALLPLTQDEAYYLRWASQLSWGYYDHPPLVAWLMYPGTIIHSAFMARALPLTLAMISFLAFARILPQIGIKSPGSQIAASCLFFFNFFSMIFGVVVTPDTPMIAFWILACAALIRGFNGWAAGWLVAGVHFGLGFLSKYTMILLGPIWLIAVILSKAQRQRWQPYGGFLVALIVVSPHLLWNHHNDWLTLRFTMSRGFDGTRSISQADSEALKLPVLAPGFDIQGQQLMATINKWELPGTPSRQKTPFEKFRRRVANYWSGQLAGFGIFALLAGFSGWRFFRMKRQRQIKATTWQTPSKLLIQLTTLVPLGFFGLVALVAKVEPNWPAAFYFGAALLGAAYYQEKLLKPRWLIAAASIHALMIVATSWGSRSPKSPLSLSNPRVLRETVGFKEVAGFLDTQKLPLLADTYQLSSQLSFYGQRSISYLPGLARTSELLRKPHYFGDFSSTWLRQKQFQVITGHINPPAVARHRVTKAEELRFCQTGLEIHNSAALNESYPTTRCDSLLRRLFLYTYSPTTSAGN